MGMKFLNKKGWHTGSLRNIETVWKAEQKHEAENRKLEELKVQIQKEREKDEFRQLQVQAGLTPAQDRLDFLYDGGLSVGNASGGFKELPSVPISAASDSTPASGSAVPSSSNSAAPGALFEEKPHSANDAWRKLHSDPLLNIRQREQEAMALIKNNPIRMAAIRKSAEAQKKDDEARSGKKKKVKSKHKRRSSSKHQSDTENASDEEMEKKAKKKGKQYLDSDEESRDRSKRQRHSHADYRSENQRHSSPVKKRADRNEVHERLDAEEDQRERTNHNSHSRKDRGSEHHSNPVREKADRKTDYRSENQRHGSPVKKRGDRNEGHARHDAGEDLRERTNHHRHSRQDHESEKGHSSPVRKRTDRNDDHDRSWRDSEKSRHEKYPSISHNDKSRSNGDSKLSDSKNIASAPKQDVNKRRGKVPQLSEEERAARLREMQMDAEVHEDQRWARLKKAAEDDAREASQAAHSQGKSFLDSVHKSVYGTEKGGSSTIEESVRRRSHFLQGRTAVDEHNAFRR